MMEGLAKFFWLLLSPGMGCLLLAAVLCATLMAAFISALVQPCCLLAQCVLSKSILGL